MKQIKIDESSVNLKRLTRDYYAQKSQKEADKYWDEGEIRIRPYFHLIF